MQQEVKLFNADRSPLLCSECGRQRIGVILNIITRAMLDCECRKRTTATPSDERSTP